MLPHTSLHSSAARSLLTSPFARVHTGEAELRDRDIGGVAVHVAAGVLDTCAPGEVLASRVLTDLVGGAGLAFQERGQFELKGIPGRWDLYAAAG